MVEVDRRDLVKGGAGALTALVAGGGIIQISSSPALAATGLTAQDVSVSSSDGELDTLTISPDITVSWSNRSSAVETVEVTWYVSTPFKSETSVGSTPNTYDVSDPSKDGSINQTMGPINFLSNNGGPLTGSNFDASDGNTTTTDVTISMDAKIKDSGDNTLATKTDILGPKTFTVQVSNTTSTTSASGTANTDGST